MIALKILFLFVAVLMTTSTVIKVRYHNPVPGKNMVWMTIGIVGFLVLQFYRYL